MKKKLFFGIALVCLLALTLVFAGCDSGGGGGPQKEPVVPKSLKISNISSELTGKNVLVLITNKFGQDVTIGEVTVAFGYRTDTGATLSLDLMDFSEDDFDSEKKWTGSGDYYVEIAILINNGNDLDEDGYGFTNGTGSLKKVTFNKAVTELSFTNFQKIMKFTPKN